MLSKNIVKMHHYPMKRALAVVSTLTITSFIIFNGILAKAQAQFGFPEGIKIIYVFSQDPLRLGPGSSKEVAVGLSVNQFKRAFPGYRADALRQKRKLIITAQTNDGRWVQEQITYNGAPLNSATYYNSGLKRTYTGAEIPLR